MQHSATHGPVCADTRRQITLPNSSTDKKPIEKRGGAAATEMTLFIFVASFYFVPVMLGKVSTFLLVDFKKREVSLERFEKRV